MLRLKERFEFLLQELAFLKQLLDALRGDLPTFEYAGVLLAELAVTLLELVIFLVYFR
jgi:hypothetical protein